jgi:putative membrane protein
MEEKYLSFFQITFVPYMIILVILTYVLNQIDAIKRLLTPISDQNEQVEKRAMLEFYQSNIKKTKDATGILFFISVLERKAIVLADQAISEQLPKDLWAKIVDLMVSGMKQNDLALGVEKALRSSGEILKPLFPVKPGDVNELSNTLQIKD